MRERAACAFWFLRSISVVRAVAGGDSDGSELGATVRAGVEDDDVELFEAVEVEAERALLDAYAEIGVVEKERLAVR